jgi:phosphoribosyl 1,2-cyclic phosphodiesterase
VRVCLLASGSKGNSVYIETGSTRLLVDAGLPAIELTRRLASIGVSPLDLDAILITHEHTDHVRGAGTLARKAKIPILASYPTGRELAAITRKVQVVEFESGHAFTFRDISIDPFPVTHDACDPVGYLLESCEGRIGIATDLGIATRLVRDKLQRCRCIVLESNHDEEMLQNGPYPWHLKQRIKSRHGHLSNNDSAALMLDLVHDGLEGLFLAHLSEVNNDPCIARDTMLGCLRRRQVCSPLLAVGDQYRPSPVLTI